MVSTPTSREVLEGIGSGLASLAGPLLAPLVETLTAPLAAVAALVAEPAPGRPSPALTDLASTPYPRSLGQVAGLVVPAGLGQEQVRAFVAGAGPSRRGTATAMRAAVVSTLTGTAQVVLLERDGSPYRVRFITYAAETPDPAATLAAAMSQKPVGLVLEHVLSAGVSWGQFDTQVAMTWERAQAYSWEQLGAIVPGTY